MNRWNPTINDKIIACYDEKVARFVPAKIIAVRGCFIQVEYKAWASDDGVVYKQWMPRISEIGFGGYLRTKEPGVMSMMFECPGDWYSVFRLSDCPEEIQERYKAKYEEN
jgi:hypothetical protein